MGKVFNIIMESSNVDFDGYKVDEVHDVLGGTREMEEIGTGIYLRLRSECPLQVTVCCIKTVEASIHVSHKHPSVLHSWRTHKAQLILQLFPP